MTPLDLYLKRLAFWLPRKKRADVLAELQGVLIEKLEAGKVAFGRPLTDVEARDVLSGFGHPALVVARYMERRPVISGGLAFFFWRVLAIALAGVLVAQTLLLIVDTLHAQSLGPVIGHALRRTFLALLLGFACVTASFIIIERRYGD